MISIRNIATKTILPLAAATLFSAAHVNSNQSKINEQSQKVSNTPKQNGNNENIPTLPLTAPMVLAGLGMGVRSKDKDGINKTDNDGYTQLHHAIENGDVDKAKEIITNPNFNVAKCIYLDAFNMEEKCSYIQFLTSWRIHIDNNKRKTLVNMLIDRMLEDNVITGDNDGGWNDMDYLLACTFYDEAERLMNHPKFDIKHATSEERHDYYNSESYIQVILNNGDKATESKKCTINKLIDKALDDKNYNPDTESQIALRCDYRPIISNDITTLMENGYVDEAIRLSEHKNCDINKRFGKNKKSYIELIIENKKIKSNDKKKFINHLTDRLVSDKEYNPNKRNVSGKTDAYILMTNDFVNNAIKMIKHPNFDISDTFLSDNPPNYISKVLGGIFAPIAIKKEDRPPLIKELVTKALQNENYDPFCGCNDIEVLVEHGYIKEARELINHYFETLVKKQEEKN